MKIFETLTVNGMTLKNRLVMAPMGLGLGLRGSRAKSFFAERARGGVGTIICGGIAVDSFARPELWDKAGGFSAFLDGVHSFAREVQKYGAKVGPQMYYGNRFPQGRGMGDMSGEAAGPSTRTGMVDILGGAKTTTRELTIAEIETIVESFGNAAANCKKAGFDFFEIHGAHETLVCQFFSPIFNQRTDRYGGDLAGRMRFCLECVKAVRASVGPDYPVFCRIGAWEAKPGGVTVEDAAELAIELERAGVDVVDVSIVTHKFAHPDKKQRMGTFVEHAARIKRGIHVPVIGVGRINSPKVAEAILGSGKVDLIGLARQLIADPYWPQKVAEGRVKEITFCDSCSTKCEDPWQRGGKLGCARNPRAGRESEEAS